MLRLRLLGLVALVLAIGGRALAAPCSGGAVLTVVGDNESADAAVDLVVTGERVVSATGCDASGSGLATTYATTVACSGAGASKCGRIPDLAPGVWVHHLAAQVSDGASAVQLQTATTVVVAGTGASNVVEWTVFGRTFVVTKTTASELRGRLDDARAYTAASPHPALVRFSANVFPGASAPKTIALQSLPSCALDTCLDGRETAYCFEGDRVTVDALDAEARPGGVVLGVTTCNNSLMRLYGTDNVWRGVVFQGTTDASPAVAVDTLTIAGLQTGGNRFEQCTIVGPTLGDALSIEGDAAQPGSGPAPENAIAGCEIRGAEDKGIKVDFGGVARVERSCVHDNQNGGIQATLGGTVTAVENVVQHNLGGAAENGLFAGVPNPEDSQFANALTTRGNVVRFNGARGISVVNHATATLADDVVTDNYRAGLRVETGLAGVTPAVTVRGSTFACNYTSGLCMNGSGQVCRVAGECEFNVCTAGSGAATGVGVALDQPCVGCTLPAVDLGMMGDAGRNAFTLNGNPNATPPGGVNLSSAVPTTVPARGNQWEHCDPADASDPNHCNMTEVPLLDVRTSNGATFDLGTPVGPRHGPVPVVGSISPARPRAGDLVRVYGGVFDAIDGMACHPSGELPADPCDAGNPDTVAKNAGNASQGNHVTVTMDGVDYDAEVHQVTPTMLVFAMPVDCTSAATLVVARGNDVALPVTLCDPDGCADRPAGAICDDDDVCTVGETCQADHTCGGGAPLSCTGACLTGTCDAVLGCAVRPASAGCEDGDACTVGDHCNGTSDACVPGGAASCAGACLTGSCDPLTGCEPSDATTGCDDGSACTTGDHCSGTNDTCVGASLSCDDGLECTADACDPTTGCTHLARPDGVTCGASEACHATASCVAGACVPGSAVSCDDGHACTDDTCDAASGCAHAARTGFAGVTCHATQLHTLLDGLGSPPASLRKALGSRLACIETRGAAADTAGQGTRRRRKQARRTAHCASSFLSRVRLAGGLKPNERTLLGDEARSALAAVQSYFGL